MIGVLEVGVKLLNCHIKGQCRLIETGIRGYASNRDLLMKNIGLCFRFSSSLNKTAPTKASKTAR